MNFMKKVLLFAVVIVCLIFIVVIISSSSNNNVYIEIPGATTISSIYVIKEYDGKVAVFKYDSSSPVQILDCKINSLPPDAAEALATGIVVSGEYELQKIIEAYD